MTPLHGIQVFEILENGNLLNGIYTNNMLGNANNGFAIDNEIARKKIYDNHYLSGNYDTRFIEHNNKAVIHYDLTITPHEGVYVFEWHDKNGALIWEGIGLKAGNNHVAVSYSRS